MLKVKIKRLTADAILPQKAHKPDAGWDLFAPLDMEPVILGPHERAVIHTGIAVDVPIGWYMQVMSRSGIAVKKSLDARAGVIDCTYRGDVGVVLHNDGWDGEVVIGPGDKIAQAVFLPVPSVDWQEVDNLDDTLRGSCGYGSTGE